MRLKYGKFQMSGQKNGSSDISKWCSEGKLWAFSDVRTKKNSSSVISKWYFKAKFGPISNVCMKKMGPQIFQSGVLRLNSGHFQMSGKNGS